MLDGHTYWFFFFTGNQKWRHRPSLYLSLSQAVSVKVSKRNERSKCMLSGLCYKIGHCGSKPGWLIKTSLAFRLLVETQWVEQALFCHEMFLPYLSLLCRKDKMHACFYMEVYFIFVRRCETDVQCTLTWDCDPVPDLLDWCDSVCVQKYMMFQWKKHGFHKEIQCLMTAFKMDLRKDWSLTWPD